ncbi:tRNA-thr(GGU) m(6)t(6)A37 methyltransferase [Tasmannia lanceolata]|uniref:tRNA-thr(GGU) m(6)t(6)A37 methyltransferase n=1 Tax=Tasmannia lanceolata TaxID=3420 RepID=UPI0040635BE4
MASSELTKWLKVSFTLAVVAISTTVVFSVCILRKKKRGLDSQIRDLEVSLASSLKKCGAERQGRIRAQQALRKALLQHNSDKSKPASYPMMPIATVNSCFSTRNGTPRQPLLVPLSRACLILDSSQVPVEALEGLKEYSHCWILYVFHLNTNMEKLWKESSRSKFKAKVRVPRLKGGRMGVLATRSPHRPCPIGLTVGKVERVHGRVVLLSGIDLVDGTPVLDIKPYLPYSDSIQGATVPKWVTADNSLSVASVNFSPDFSSTLANCWVTAEKQSLYTSPDEFRSLIEQVLSWDIRSLAQRNRPHNPISKKESHEKDDLLLESGDDSDTELDGGSSGSAKTLQDITYHLTLEGIDVSYRIDGGSNVIVEKATLSFDAGYTRGNRCNYKMCRDMLFSE